MITIRGVEAAAQGSKADRQLNEFKNNDMKVK